MTKDQDIEVMRLTLPTGESRVLGAIRGSTCTPWPDKARGLVADVQRALSSAREATTNSLMTAAERHDATRAKVMDSVSTVEALASEVTDAKAALKAAMATASIAKPYTAAGFEHIHFDLRIVDMLVAMQPHERAARLAEMEAAPAAHLRALEALQRVPREITGVDHDTLQRLRVASVKVFAPDIYEGLDREAQELAIAESVVRGATRVIGDTADGWKLIRGDAPSAHALVNDVTPVAWPATRTND